MIEDDSINGSIIVGETPEKYEKPEKKLLMIDKLRNIVKQRSLEGKITTYKDFADVFGGTGSLHVAIRKITQNGNYVRKYCPTGRCNWFEYKS